MMHKMLDVDEPYTLLSGYRTPQTNAMLRRRSGGVAKNSLHMKGKAADLRLRSRSVSQMARAATKISAGGVGQSTHTLVELVVLGDVQRAPAQEQLVRGVHPSVHLHPVQARSVLLRAVSTGCGDGPPPNACTNQNTGGF